jgi:hypothetical protein
MQSGCADARANCPKILTMCDRQAADTALENDRVPIPVRPS